jgi:hypothetical protein
MIVTSRNERDAVPHIDSLHALDWLNFSLAALLTGSGPFVAVKLADRGWMASDIGLILTAGGLASLFTQVPAGELIDMSRSKRALLGLATGAVILGVLVFGLRPDSPPPSSARLSSRAWPAAFLGPGSPPSLLGWLGGKPCLVGSAAISASHPWVALRQPPSRALSVMPCPLKIFSL